MKLIKSTQLPKPNPVQLLTPNEKREAVGYGAVV